MSAAISAAVSFVLLFTGYGFTDRCLNILFSRNLPGRYRLRRMVAPAVPALVFLAVGLVLLFPRPLWVFLPIVFGAGLLSSTLGRRFSDRIAAAASRAYWRMRRVAPNRRG